jgi:hypothetical protein
MIWLTWRQSRLESLIGGAALGLVAVFLLWTGHNMISAYDGAGLPHCVAIHSDDQTCWDAADTFLNQYRGLVDLMGWLNLLPFLVGLLLAAPTVLDLEQGTYRLAWTQSVTRRRWLAARIGYGLAAAVAIAAGLIALSTWWRGPFDDLQGRFNSDGFDFEGTVLVGYVVFAFALCLAVGTLLRRSIPAFGLGFVLFLVARIGTLDKLRPHYLDPIRLTWDPLDPAPAAAVGRFGDGSWIISQGVVNAAGHDPKSDGTLRACFDAITSRPTAKGIVMASGDTPFNRCLHENGYLNVLVYHPASRFWTFQAIETALFLSLATALLALTAWWVTRRVA